jgi:hypothetical protein
MKPGTLENLLVLGWLILLSYVSQAQEGKKIDFSGYLKNMQSAIFPGNDVVLMENLIHHRLNFRWDIQPDISVVAGLRNRVFAGNFTALNPNLGRDLKEISDDWIPLSVLWFDRGQYAAHSTLDRLYMEYSVNSWNIRVGRQRINWGINLAFNPNDLFNAYNFLDFDYEERPGADAIRVQYYYDFASGFDLVYNAGDLSNQGGMALRWFFNKNQYDYQIIGGLVRGDITLGGGWSGYLKNAGWKGEATLFLPTTDSDLPVAFSATTGIDYSFGKGWMIYGSYLFNSDVDRQREPVLTQNVVLTARNLYPFQHNFLIQLSYPASPLVTLSSAFIYSADSAHPLVFSPNARISLSENWDLDLIGQSFWPMGRAATFDNVSLVFLRIRYSY